MGDILQRLLTFLLTAIIAALVLMAGIALLPGFWGCALVIFAIVIAVRLGVA